MPEAPPLGDEKSVPVYDRTKTLFSPTTSFLREGKMERACPQRQPIKNRAREMRPDDELQSAPFPVDDRDPRGPAND